MDIRQEIKNFFSEGGILAEKFDNYEYRRSQEEMALAVLDSLENKTHIFVEAPTGVGKSFAYLIPAIYYAKKYKKKAVISTHTINLQEQLIYKDIPFLKEVLPVDFKASLMKGKSNYICPKRLGRSMDKANSLFENDEQVFLDRLYSWSKETDDGTRSDISFPILENVWTNVCAERGVCSTKTCGVKETECFFQKAKLELADSDLIIVNHHLFFTLYDGVIGEAPEGYLYRNDFLVFDEAHTIEDIAAAHIFPRLSREMIRYNLLRLYNEKKRKGFLLSFPSLHVLPIVQNLLELNQEFFHKLKAKLFHMNNGKLARLTERVYEPDIIENTIEGELTKLIESLRRLKQNCETEWEENELSEYSARFSEFRYLIGEFIKQKRNEEEGSKFVYWVEVASNKPDANISLCSSPIDISDFFRENIFRPENSSILTSATLTINNSFEYFKKRLGGEVARELKLPPQFDFYNQVKIFIPKYMPAPAKDNSNEYIECLKEEISTYVKLTEGKALVLFTNGYLLNKIGSELAEGFSGAGISLLMQKGGISRKMLLNEFKSDVNSVLFGLDSFWLGVDVPGEALSNLIVTKLPFLVPDHPVVKARMEFIDSRGGNSFLEYSLPEAVLKFRQGIGRLIRGKDDRGIIVILDSRVISKFYGKFFLNSIDECEIEIIEKGMTPVNIPSILLR